MFLTACAGTGTKIKPAVSLSKEGETKLYFVRSSGYIASGVLAKIEVNGNESIFLPQTRTINSNSTLVKDSFNISSSDDSLLILFWRGK